MLQKIVIKKNKEELNLNIEALDEMFEVLFFLNSNKKYNSNLDVEYAQLIAIGSVRQLLVKNEAGALEKLRAFIGERSSWLFGFLCYDLKNEIEVLSSKNVDFIDAPDLLFFEPEFLVELTDDEFVLNYDDEFKRKSEAENLIKLLLNKKTAPDLILNTVSIKERVSKQEYINAVNGLKRHIALGDIYEINFCQEFYAECAQVEPYKVYLDLNKISTAPFSSYCKYHNLYLMSSSPERFLKRTGDKLISQPIKGTARRSKDKEEDDKIRTALRNNEKEQSENVMIVDLVRNDLSKIARKGTVNVDELFGIYTFSQVHQMISTVSCELKKKVDFVDIIEATFPMGSMTGAPKIRAMQLIEEFESTKRGLYSGSMGYISPEGDFDFNVVIRSILYNAKNKYLSFMVGSAITTNADAEKEYEECLLKARAMFQVLKNDLKR